jgi:hypothetical protein
MKTSKGDNKTMFENSEEFSDVLDEIITTNASKYAENPLQYFLDSRENTFFVTGSEDMLFAQARYYMDIAHKGGSGAVESQATAHGLIEAYAIMTGTSYVTAYQRYKKNIYGGSNRRFSKAKEKNNAGVPYMR